MEIEIDVSGTSSIYGGCLIYIKCEGKAPYIGEIPVKTYQNNNDRQRKENIRNEAKDIVLNGLNKLIGEQSATITLNPIKDVFEGLTDYLRMKGHTVYWGDKVKSKKVISDETHLASEKEFGELLRKNYKIDKYWPIVPSDKNAPMKNLNHQEKQIKNRKDYANVKTMHKRVRALMTLKSDKPEIVL